ncbi:MAG: hypothetical protein K2X69_03090 [Silvanigrellaceae bacterium]|nr:hypothetical protein [Silvanigrellaceae bacterium]
MESQEMIKLKEDFKKLTRNEQIALINEKKIELAEIYLDKRLIEIQLEKAEAELEALAVATHLGKSSGPN